MTPWPGNITKWQAGFCRQYRPYPLTMREGYYAKLLCVTSAFKTSFSMIPLKLFMSGNSWKIQLSGHTHNDLNSCSKQNSAIYNLKMGTMSASFVLVFKLETKYPFISIETKKTKIGYSRHILPWNKNLFGERKSEIMTHCPWV